MQLAIVWGPGFSPFASRGRVLVVGELVGEKAPARERDGRAPGDSLRSRQATAPRVRACLLPTKQQPARALQEHNE